MVSGSPDGIAARRIGAMPVDKLDGRIDARFFDRMAAQWRDEQLSWAANVHPRGLLHFVVRRSSSWYHSLRHIKAD
jgi:hypothetical protein